MPANRSRTVELPPAILVAVALLARLLAVLDYLGVAAVRTVKFVFPRELCHVVRPGGIIR